MEQKIAKNLLEAYLKGEIKKEKPTPILSYHDDKKNLKINILTPNDITLLFGETSCGKSKIGAFFIKQLLIKNPEQNFVRLNNKKPFKVVVIETEMTEQNVWNYFATDNFHEYKIINKAIDELFLEKCFKIYSLSQYSIDECNEQLKLIVEEEKKYLNVYNIILFIDNLGSFVEDLNSTNNNGWMKDFKALVSSFTTICVMHSNIKENSNKKNATGSLGSAVEKIVANRFQVEKILKGASLTLLKSKTQNDRNNVKLPFSYTELENSFFVSVSDLPFTPIKDENDTQKKRHDDFKMSNVVLNYLNKKPLDSPDRLKNNARHAFPDYYQKTKMDQVFARLIEKGILIEENKYLRHKDEPPF